MDDQRAQRNSTFQDVRKTDRCSGWEGSYARISSRQIGSTCNGTAEMEVAGIAAENGAFGADQQLSLRMLHSLTLRPSRIVYPGQMPHQLQRPLSIELEKLNTQLMASYDPPNGDGRYFQ